MMVMRLVGISKVGDGGSRLDREVKSRILPTPNLVSNPISSPEVMR